MVEKSFSENNFLSGTMVYRKYQLAKKQSELKVVKILSQAPFKQIQFAFDKDYNYIFTKYNINQKGLDEK